MEHYTIIFYNDMGHLMIRDFFNIPKTIRDFAYEVVRNKIDYATDNNNLGCSFYILKPRLNDKWSYNYNNVQLTIDYSKLDKFDSSRMIYS
jgi:hypothetical protein